MAKKTKEDVLNLDNKDDFDIDIADGDDFDI